MKMAKKGESRKRTVVAVAVTVMNRGAWTAEEDNKLVEYVRIHGDKNWRTLPEKAGLNRCGKSCRLRWLNYLRPGIKRGNMTDEEDDLIIRLHNLIGNRWSLIAARLPGRTDNEIKNYWNAHLSKRSVSLDDLNRKLNQKTHHSHRGGLVRPLATRLASGCRREYSVDDDSAAWIPPSRTASAHGDDLHMQVETSSPEELMMTHAAVFDLEVDQLLDLRSGGRISCSTDGGDYTELEEEARDCSVQAEASAGSKFEGEVDAWEFDDLDKLIDCEENSLHGLYFLNI